MVNVGLLTLLLGGGLLGTVLLFSKVRATTVIIPPGVTPTTPVTPTIPPVDPWSRTPFATVLESFSFAQDVVAAHPDSTLPYPAFPGSTGIVNVLLAVWGARSETWYREMPDWNNVGVEEINAGEYRYSPDLGYWVTLSPS